LVSKNLAMKPGLTLWMRFNDGRRYPVICNYAINLLSNNAISHFLTFLQVTGNSFAQSQPAIALFEASVLTRSNDGGGRRGREGRGDQGPDPHRAHWRALAHSRFGFGRCPRGTEGVARHGGPGKREESRRRGKCEQFQFPPAFPSRRLSIQTTRSALAMPGMGNTKAQFISGRGSTGVRRTRCQWEHATDRSRAGSEGTSFARSL